MKKGWLVTIVVYLFLLALANLAPICTGLEAEPLYSTVDESPETTVADTAMPAYVWFLVFLAVVLGVNVLASSAYIKVVLQGASGFSREAAAECSPGREPGVDERHGVSAGGTTGPQAVAPTGAQFEMTPHPGLTPGATLYRRSAAESGQSTEQAIQHERRVLSRELHDEVGQSLTALAIELGCIARLKDGPTEQFDKHLLEARRLSQQTLRTIRSIAAGLRLSALDHAVLIHAIRLQAEEVSRRSGVRVTVHAEDGFNHLPNEYQACVYRMIQEGLTNCVKHARADAISIQLSQDSECFCVEVADDGAGFNGSSTGGLGLIGMRERAQELGGTVQISSIANKGTTLRLLLPGTLGNTV